MIKFLTGDFKLFYLKTIHSNGFENNTDLF